MGRKIVRPRWGNILPPFIENKLPHPAIRAMEFSPRSVGGEGNGTSPFYKNGCVQNAPKRIDSPIKEKNNAEKKKKGGNELSHQRRHEKQERNGLFQPPTHHPPIVVRSGGVLTGSLDSQTSWAASAPRLQRRGLYTHSSARPHRELIGRAARSPLARPRRPVPIGRPPTPGRHVTSRLSPSFPSKAAGIGRYERSSARQAANGGRRGGCGSWTARGPGGAPPRAHVGGKAAETDGWVLGGDGELGAWVLQEVIARNSGVPDACVLGGRGGARDAGSRTPGFFLAGLLRHSSY